MSLRTSLTAIGASIVLVLAAIVISPGVPARAASPTGVSMTGETDGWSNEAGFRLGMVLHPWNILGFQLGIGTTTGAIDGQGYKSSSKTSCMFGLAWGISITTTAPRTVTFTCILVTITTVYGQPLPAPAILTAAVTAVDGPGGSLSLGPSGPYASSETDPITVTYY